MTWVVCLALAALVTFAYRRVGHNGFVGFDDPRYVSENPIVGRGLTLGGAAWAFGSFRNPYWHPLTWLSHMADVGLLGLDPGLHHWASVAWHAVNTVLFFLVLRSASGATWRSALAAALFAVHPLRVESVAWVAERKDLLSCFFWLIAMGAYVAWARRPGPGRYLLVAAAFALGLMSKPMAVTLPLALILVDVWPLGRLGGGEPMLHRLASLVFEKIPLFAIAASSAALALVVETLGGEAHYDLETLPVPTRLANAVVSYATYLRDIFWPAGLSVFYPHPAGLPGGIPWSWIAASTLVVSAVSAIAVWQWSRRPFLAVGWLWFIVTLLPVIGLVQVGLQGRADRFTYIPAMGIFMAVAWAVPDPGAGWLRRSALGAGIAVLVAFATWRTEVQTTVWKDQLTLFLHASEVVPESALVWDNLGVEYFHRGQAREALQAFERAVAARPDEVDGWVNVGMARGALGDHAGAATAFQEAVRLRPEDEVALFNLGIASALAGHGAGVDEAATRLSRRNPAKAQELIHAVQQLQSGAQLGGAAR